MSSAIIYFGVPPSGNQVVSEEVSKRGLNLVKVAPSHYRISAISRNTLPMYKLYLEYLPAFIYSGYERARVSLKNFKFPGFPPSYDADEYNPLVPKGDLVFHFSNKNDMIDLIRQNYPSCLVSKSFGNNVYVIPGFVSSLKDIVGHNPILTTKTGDGQLNIDSFRSCVRLSRAIHAFLKIHQYASYKNSSPSEEELWQEMDSAKLPEANLVVDTDGLSTLNLMIV